MKTIKKLLPLVGIGLFIYVLLKIDINKLQLVYQNAAIDRFVYGMSLVLIAFASKSIRFFLILKGQHIEMPFHHSVRIFFQSSLWGFISPGRIGELSKVFYIKPYATQTEKLLLNPLIDRVLDLTAILLFLLLAAFALDVSQNMSILLTVLITLVVLGGIYFILTKYIDRLSSISFQKGYLLLKELVALDHKFQLYLLTLLIFLIHFWGMYLLSKSIGIHCSFLFIIYCTTLAFLIAVLPITFAGMGTRDALLLIVFQNHAIQAEYAVAYSSLFICIYLLLIGFSFLTVLTGNLFWSKPVSKEKL